MRSMTMKYEWRKHEKNFYSINKKPVLLTIPAQKFLLLHGTGNPNGSAFQKHLESLYPAAYGLKFAYKKFAENIKTDFDDYVVFPLESVWSLTEKGQQLDHLDKNELSYDIMIRIPDFVPDNLIQPTLQEIQEKKQLPEIADIQIRQYPQMAVVQIMHVGSYDTELTSFKKLDELVASERKTRFSKIHREIYLSDARRVEPDKLKTILRYQVK